jgi:hypothetical protein
MSQRPSFLTPSTARGVYTRPAHRACLAPAGVDGVGASPTPFSSTTNSTGAPVSENPNGNPLENQSGGVAVGKPAADVANVREKFIPNKDEFLGVFNKLNRFTSNRALQLGDQNVLDAVNTFFQTFFGCVVEAEDAYDLKAAVECFSLETATPTALALEIFRVVKSRGGAPDLAVLADEIINVYHHGPSPPSPGTAGVDSPGVNELVKGMSDALSKLGSSAGAVDLTTVRAAIVANRPDFYTDLNTGDYGGAVIPLMPWVTIANTAPLDRLGLLSRPLLNSNRLSGMLLPVVKEHSLYPQSRSAILVEVATLFAHHLGLHILNGMNATIAMASAEADASRVVVEGAKAVAELQADILELARTQAGTVGPIIKALDRHFKPVTILGEAEWWRLDAIPGESFYCLFGRVRGVAARLNKKYDDLTTRLDTILYGLVTSGRGVDMVPVIANDFKLKHATVKNGADLARLLHGEALHVSSAGSLAVTVS